MDVLSAVVTLFLVMDPLGNVPLFLSVLKTVPPPRRRRVLVREILIAYAVLVAFCCSDAGCSGSWASSRRRSRSPAASCCS
jgi:small neutral amino acid transporter SnatA (MarC family)